MSAEPRTSPVPVVTGRFTSASVERILGASIAGACIVFGAQAFLASAGSTETGRWHVPLLVLVFGSLCVLIVSGLTGWFARAGQSLFTIAYLVALTVWALVAQPAGQSPAQPWIWYLMNVATVAAVLAFPRVWGIVLTVALPLAFTAIRLRGGGALSADFIVSNVADLSFSVMFGFVLLALVWLFRSVAGRLDATRATALESYGRAAAAEAAEQERMEMAALMHDSVLSALIAAERASSPRERELAASMARDALTGLANAEGDVVAGSDMPVPVSRIAEEINETAASFGLELDVVAPAGVELPGRVVRAVSMAGTQAVVNAVQHAGARGLVVRLDADGDGCDLLVSDSGPGIDVSHIPDDRLGLRASIFARMAAVGGVAELTTRRSGTQIVLRWRR